jgi:hypothetical protein
MVVGWMWLKAVTLQGTWREVQLLVWVHTCNITTYRDAVTLQVADTVWSYELNLHPVTVRRNSNHHA